MEKFLHDTQNFWRKKSIFYILKFENKQNLYKFGITTNFAQRKANIKQAWKNRDIDISIDTLIAIPIKTFAKANVIESTVRLKLIQKKVVVYGNDYFKTDNIENILNIIQKIVEK